VLVPYVLRNPGTRLEEIARLFNVSEAEVLADLNLLFVSGLPPYGPGDLIDVLIEDGRVWIRMADYFARPVRLTRSEALDLYLQAKALSATPGLPEADALSTALAKLEEGLGEETLGEVAGKVEAAGAGSAPQTLDRVRRACEEHERLEIEHYSASREEILVRRIDPEEVFSAMGNWYVVAWDHKSEAERMFRADRIRRVEGTGEHFTPRGLPGAGRPLYTRSEEDIPVRLHLGAGARWVAEYYETESAVEGEGGLEVVVPTKQLAWMARLVVRLGGEARVLGPPELRELARRVAEETLARYAPRDTRKKASGRRSRRSTKTSSRRPR
jgi:proteasome accessory factor C